MMVAGESVELWQGDALRRTHPVALDGEVARFDGTGAPLERISTDVGISAVAPLGTSTAVGYRDGAVVLFGAQGESRELERAVASRPTRIALGPADTLLVGFADGTLGLWSSSGALLAQARLHGRVEHLAVDGTRSYAVTDLGRWLRWDLGIFELEHCALLHEIWRSVPVVWADGGALAGPPPTDHACATEG